VSRGHNRAFLSRNVAARRHSGSTVDHGLLQRRSSRPLSRPNQINEIGFDQRAVSLRLLRFHCYSSTAKTPTRARAAGREVGRTVRSSFATRQCYFPNFIG